MLYDRKPEAPLGPRADLLGEARDGTLFQVELQSSSDSRMAFRMLDYLVAIERGQESGAPREG